MTLSQQFLNMLKLLYHSNVLIMHCDKINYVFYVKHCLIHDKNI